MLTTEELRKPEIITRLVNASQEIYQTTQDMEAVLYYLRKVTGSKLQTIKIIRYFLDISVEQGKILVDQSDTWKDRYEMDEVFRKLLLEALQEIGD